MLGRIANILTAVIIAGIVLYALQWVHLFDRIMSICDRNPNFLADCRRPLGSRPTKENRMNR